MYEESVLVKKRVSIVTNNVNCERHVQYYSNLEKYFITNGWEIREDFNVDKVIICGCGFHDVMHEKVAKTVKELEELHYPDHNMIVMGCQSKTHEMELNQNMKVKIVAIGDEEELDRMIDARIPFAQIPPNNILRPYKGCVTDEKDEYFHIKVAQGCLRRCTFCVINKAKGYIKSVPREEIIEQFKKAIALGKRKIYLMGEDTLAYGHDNGTNIIELVDELLAIEPDLELNFGSLHILWIKKYADGLLSLCKRGIVKELHMGLQHISEPVLKRMGRAIKFSEVYEIIRNIKKEAPDVFMEADILVGFPGETKENFDELVEFFNRDKCFNNVRHFGYSDVKGAPSYHFTDKLSTSEVVHRWEYLDKILGERSSNFKQDDANPMDIAFQLTHEKNYTYCKDTFKDDVEQVVEDCGVMVAKPKAMQIKEDDFSF